MPRALVTGSKGFVGQNLIKKLLNEGFTIKEVDDEYFSEKLWPHKFLHELDSESLDVIFHVGACTNTLETDVQSMMERNYESTKILSDWSSKNKIPIIYSSSAANLGTNGLYPSNLYGWSKYAAEGYVIKSGGVALRYFNVYGPGEDKKGKMASFLYQAIIKQKRGEVVQLFPGEPKRDFIYIDDVVSANVYALRHYRELKSNYYEISTGVASSFESVLGMADIFFEYTKESEIPAGYQFYTCGNPTKWMPGWRPLFPLERGIEDYLRRII